MPAAAFTLVNKVAYSHNSLIIRLYGIQVLSVTECSWKVSVEKGEVKGQPREALGHTIGNAKYECSFTLNKAEWNDIKTRVRLIYGVPVMDLESDLVFQIASRNLPTCTYQVHVDGLTEDEHSSSAGNDATVSKITCSVLYIKENGQPLISGSIY